MRIGNLEKWFFKYSGLTLMGWLLMMMPSFAFQLLPMSQEFAPSGSQATRSYQIKNTKSKAIAVEVSMMQRFVDAAGQETRIPELDDFIVYPPQVLLAPGQQQTIRVTWVGAQEPPQELSYRLVAEELSVPLQSTDPSSNGGDIKTQVELLFSYAGSVYVRPVGAQARVVLETIQPVQLSDGQPGLEIYLKNQGNSRRILEAPQIRLESQGESILLEGEILGAINRRTILADGERRFQIPWPEGLPQGSISGELIVK